ncbi:MAG: hypothetical protein J5563_02055 [Clostridia bacterium]|nr:hypothetical protein [Clostridia bacterium]
MKRAAVTVFSLLLSALLPFGACAATVSGSVIPSVVIEDGQVKIDAEITGYYAESGTEIFLFRCDSENEKPEIPLSAATAAKSVSFSVPFDFSDRGNFGAGYQLGVRTDSGYEAISGIRHIANISDFALNTGAYPPSYTKKGLEIADITDAQRLGVGHTTVNVYLDLLIADDGIPFFRNGETIFINRDVLSRLDGRMKSLTLAGINVYMNVLPSKGSEGSPPSDNARTLSSVLSFLTERYTAQSMKYGFCGSFIIGHELNAGCEGYVRNTEYVRVCGEWLRECYVAAVSAYSGARVYVSVSNRWHSPTLPDAYGGLGAREFLDGLAVTAPDIPFGIAVCAYPSDPATTDFLTDRLADESDDAQFVTVKNLSVMCEHFPGRRIVVSEFGIGGSGNGQAEQFLSAYDIVSRLDAVETLIWHRHVDNAGEDLKFGLYTSGPSGNAKEAKPLAEAFGSAGVDVFRPEISTRRGTDNKSLVIDFVLSANDFYPSDNSKYLVCNDGYMRIASSYAGPIGFFGAGKTFDASLFDGAGTMSVSLRVTGEGNLTAAVLLSAGGRLLEADAQVSNGEWTTLTFDVREFLAGIGDCAVYLKLWARNDEGSGDMFLDVRGISFDSRSGVLPVVMGIVICAALATAAATAAALLAKKRKKGRKNGT